MPLEKPMEKSGKRTGTRPAIFLDRDGVLCREKGYITEKEELDIFPETRDCIELLHQKGFLAICITNQSAVARGILSEQKLQEMNEYLIRETGLDAVYYCPHHPNGIGKYCVSCNCRKPDTGMILCAMKDFEIKKESSYMVGDRASDILCGQKAGVKTVLLESGYGSLCLESPVSPDFVYDNLKTFVESGALFL